MQRSAMSHTAASIRHDPEVASGDQAGGLLSWMYKAAERFGLPVVILLLVLWWARTDVVQPLLDAHFSFIDKIVAGQERHAEEVREVGRKIDQLIEVARGK